MEKFVVSQLNYVVADRAAMSYYFPITAKGSENEMMQSQHHNPKPKPKSKVIFEILFSKDFLFCQFVVEGEKVYSRALIERHAMKDLWKDDPHELEWRSNLAPSCIVDARNCENRWNVGYIIADYHDTVLFLVKFHGLGYDCCELFNRYARKIS